MSMMWQCPDCGAYDETGWVGPDATHKCPECGAEMQSGAIA